MVSLVLTCCPLGADGEPYRDVLARAMYAQANLPDPEASAASPSNRVPRPPNLQERTNWAAAWLSQRFERDARPCGCQESFRQLAQA